MGYYIRVLGTSNPNIHIEELIRGLTAEGLIAKFNIDQNESADNWTVIRISNSDGNALMQIERNPVMEGELGGEEIEEFKDDIKEYKPNSAVKWLTKYFDKVKVIYAFQLLDASIDEENSSIVNSIKSTIWNKIGGILQADNEGFSNEDGYHILWQFPEEVTGEWNMAIRNFWGNWTNFKMDLEDKNQREEFSNGKIPKKAKLI
jgi:hypothetical protein